PRNKIKSTLSFATAVLLLAASLVLSSSAQSVQTTPFYRIFAHSTGIHFFTTDVNRKQSAQGAGWNSEGTPFYVLNQQAPGTVPLYVLTIKLRFLSTEGTGDVFLFTTHPEERTSLINSPYLPLMLGGGYSFNSRWIPDGTSGVAGYIAGEQLPGTVPLYRLYHPPVFGAKEDLEPNVECKLAANCSKGRYCVFNDYDALLTTSEKEKADALKFHGYQYVETLGYVWPAAMAVSMLPANHTPKISTTSDKPVNVDTYLLSAGCLRTGVGQYGCSNLGAFNACKSYLKDGRAKGCTYTGDAAKQAEMDKTLFTLGCTHFLGRTDEFICKTPASLDACRSYKNKGQAKRCEMAK
ncbi:MAG TPA: hypothetical protein VMZ26_06020, partial [Pyrinomonadaceae bacterium]|nr:hypothetical protein [Pyrinomonadaceae bacterium]